MVGHENRSTIDRTPPWPPALAAHHMSPPANLLAQRRSPHSGDEGGSMEIWGMCRSCDRWFYCPMGKDRACPVCAAEPEVIENREAGVS
jgi:hypothetical protein